MIKENTNICIDHMDQFKYFLHDFCITDITKIKIINVAIILFVLINMVIILHVYKMAKQKSNISPISSPPKMALQD